MVVVSWRLWNKGMNEVCDDLLGAWREKSAAGRGLARTKMGDRANVAMISDIWSGWRIAMVLEVSSAFSFKGMLLFAWS